MGKQVSRVPGFGCEWEAFREECEMELVAALESLRAPFSWWNGVFLCQLSCLWWDTHTNQVLESQLWHWQKRKIAGRDKPQDSCDALGLCVWEGGSSGFAVSVMSLGAGEAPRVDAEWSMNRRILKRKVLGKGKASVGHKGIWEE